SRDRNVLVVVDSKVESLRCSIIAGSGTIYAAQARRRLVDRIDLAGEVAVVGTCSAQGITARILNGVVINQIETDRAIAYAGPNGDCIGRAGNTDDAYDRGARHAGCDQREIC